MAAHFKDTKELAQIGLALDPDNPNQLVPISRISGSQKFADQTQESLIAIAQRRYGLIIQAEVTLAVQFWHFGDVLQAIRKRHHYGRWLDFVKAQRWTYYRVSTALRIRRQHEKPEAIDGRTVEEALGYDPREYKGSDEADTDDLQPRDEGGASTPQWLFEHCSQLAIETCGEPISLDVAAAPWNTKCARYFTEADDGRKQEWNAEAVFCNPPYKASIIEEFVRKGIDAANRRTTSVFLVPWWNYPYMDLCERHGRIHRICSPVSFRREDGSTFVMNNGFRSTPLVVVVFGPTTLPGFGSPIRKNDTPAPTSGDDIDGNDEENEGPATLPPIQRDGQLAKELDLRNREKVYTSVWGDNADLMEQIASLYFRPGYRIADLTYGKGVFWRNIDTTQYDFHPSDPITCPKAPFDCRRLPYPDASFDVVVLDPPYMHGSGPPGIEACYRNAETMKGAGHAENMRLYEGGMAESARILKPGGLLLVKCQDEIESGRQQRSHIEIYEMALRLDMKDQDLFTLTQKQPPTIQDPDQQHARKNHSYMWIFKKNK